ncbi:MAG: hypothetical protein AB1810_11410 [Pseudomonadota bacterium]
MIQQVNLFQPPFKKEKPKFPSAQMLSAVLACVLLIAAVAVVEVWRARQAQNEVAALEKQSQDLTRQRDELGIQLAQRRQRSPLDAQIEKLERILTHRQQLQQMMAQDLFGQGEGYSGYLIAMARQHISGIALLDITIDGAGREITLRGRTSDPALVPKYLQRMSQEDRLAGTQFHTFRIERPQDENESHYAGDVDFFVSTRTEEPPR